VVETEASGEGVGPTSRGCVIHAMFRRGLEIIPLGR
jgi:hypothetical protein